MTTPLLIDPADLFALSNGHVELQDQLGRDLADLGTPPSDWPSGAAVVAVHDASKTLTAQMMARLGKHSATLAKNGDAYQAQEVDNSRTLKDNPANLGDKAKISDLLSKVKTIPSFETRTDYDRKCGAGHGCDFGEAWHDPDRPGCDTRDKILQRDLNDVVTTPERNGEPCKVTSGWEIDPYWGHRIDKSQVQIDHIFPLQRAWDSGAYQWTQEERTNFANDPDNLIAVGGPANQAKSWMGPGQWLPQASEQPDYVERYLNVAVKYDLPLTQADYDACAKVLGGMG